MAEGGTTESPDNPHGSGLMDYDAILKTQRELTPENLKSIANLIDVSMRIVNSQKPDQKTGFKTAYVMTRKITGTNFFNRKSDPNGNRFYVMVRDFNKPGMDDTEGLVAHYKKTGPNLEPISEGYWTLPRSADLVRGEYLSSLKSGDQDWSVVDELTHDLQTNLKVDGKGIYIDEELYNKSTR